MIFAGRNRVRYNYSRFGWTRGGGKTWHGGLDVEGMDDPTIRMPGYRGKAITGKVIRARIVTDRRDKTWEWGWYVTVQLDAAQTPDAVNYLIFAHCSRIAAKVGQRVKTGDVLAVMGNSGNAALADPPYAHVHFECRQSISGRGLDPTAYAGVQNKPGIYAESEAAAQPSEAGEILVTVRPGTWYLRAQPALSGAILGVVRGGSVCRCDEKDAGWYHTEDGWLSGTAVQKAA